MKKLILFSNLIIIPSINLYAQEKVTIEYANHAEYLKIAEEEIITLWDEVKISSGKMQLEADWIQLNLTQDELLAKGKVTLINEQGNRIESEEAKYNLKTQQGKINTPYIFIKPYYCNGYEAYFEPGTITLYDASLTTCDLHRPHYSLTAPKIIIYPNDKITAKNVLFKVGKLPLFYVPNYSKPLKQRKSRMVMKPGRSNIKGTSLGITYDYFFTPKSIGSLHLNFLEKQGVGQGIEHKYWGNNTSQGESYFYYINERKKRSDVKDTKRWEITTEHLQRFKDITGILHLQLLSDKNFTRDYLREGRYSAETWELKNYLAITKTYPEHTIRLLGEQIDLWNNELEDFNKETILSPKLTLQTKSTEKNNIYSNLKIEVANQFNSATSTRYLKTDVEANFLKKRNLSNNVVFSPKIGLLGTFKEKEKPTGWLNTNLNLRNRNGRYLEINLNHNLKKEFKTDEYHGVKTNALTSTLYMWINKRMRGEITTGFDLRKNKYEHLKINKTRVFPLVADLNLALSDNFITSLKTTYSFKLSKIEEVETYFDFKKDKWQYGGSGLYRRANTKENDILDISNYVAFNILPKTYIRLHIYYDLENRRIKESGLTIDQDLHCWNSKFSIRHIKDTEFWISFNIK